MSFIRGGYICKRTATRGTKADYIGMVGDGRVQYHNTYLVKCESGNAGDVLMDKKLVLPKELIGKRVRFRLELVTE